MTWKEIIKAPPLTQEEEKLVQEEMRFRNLDRATAERQIRRKTGKLGQRKQPTYEDYMRNYKAEEEDLPEDVKRARERIRQGLPSREQPLIPQFDDDSKKAEDRKPKTHTLESYNAHLKSRSLKNVEEATKKIREAFEGIDHVLLLSVLNPTNENEATNPSMTKKELVDMMVENTIKRLKSDRLYR